MTTIRILGPTQKATAYSEIATLPEDGTMQVVIREYKRNRSNAQNRLLWLWCQEWAHHEKETDVELIHNRNKWRFGRHIFIQAQAELVDMVAAIDAIHNTPEYGVLALAVAANMRSSKLNTKDFSDYLGIIEVEGRQRGIDLTITGDLYEEAMPKRKTGGTKK